MIDSILIMLNQISIYIVNKIEIECNSKDNQHDPSCSIIVIKLIIMRITCPIHHHH